MIASIVRRAAGASERLAISVTTAVVSPWSFWILFALCLLQLVSAKVATDVLYISNDIQLLLLPLLGISQTVGQAAAGRQARRDYEILVARWEEMNEKIDQILESDWGLVANGVRGVANDKDSVA